MLSFRKIGLCLPFIFLAACGGGNGSNVTADTGEVIVGSLPVAEAGGDQYFSFQEGMEINLNGSSSSDPDGDALEYQWAFVSVPTGSQVRLDNNSATSPSFTPDIAGEYFLQLKVIDAEGNSSSDEIKIIMAANARPLAAITGDGSVVVGESAAWSSHNSSDPEGESLTYQWQVSFAPAGSALQGTASTLVDLAFIPDVEGSYVLELIVNDGAQNSVPTSMTIQAHNKVYSLPYDVVDAEYNSSNDTIVLVSASPNQLHVYNTSTHSETVLELSQAPTSVSVSPDGFYAAVGHNGSISYVRLTSTSLVKTISVPLDVLDVVLAGNGHAYLFPRVDQWETIRTVNISTELVTESTGSSIRAGTFARLHPSGTVIYGADNGLSPSDIEKYDISGGNADYLYDSPYHGDYDMCGDLWFSSTGDRIFTACGNAFFSSSDEDEDMIYSGALANFTFYDRVGYVAHSEVANTVLAVPEKEDTWDEEDLDRWLYKYDGEFLTLTEQVLFSSFVQDGYAYQSHGRYLFYHSDGSKYFAVVQAPEDSALDGTYGVIAY